MYFYFLFFIFFTGAKVCDFFLLLYVNMSTPKLEGLFRRLDELQNDGDYEEALGVISQSASCFHVTFWFVYSGCECF